ncbi:hypothetical protein [Streptomyces tsukubensis]|uniref:hypothetical protein n=1 Tax=Streptomyces tsukubensis TaxID=83656 RepID=UPI00344D7686
MSEGFTGDPYHEGASQPLAGLKGDMAQPNTQQPMDSEAQTNPRSAATDNVAQTWNSTSLAPTPAGTGSSDSRKPR